MVSKEFPVVEQRFNPPFSMLKIRLDVEVDLDVATVNSMGVMTRQVGLTTITFVKPRTI